jgi:membrane protease YdiL (CAAX protease family)
VVGGLVLIVTMSIFLVNTIFPLIGLLPPHVKSSEITDDLPEFLFFMIVTGWGTAAFGEEMLLRGFILDRIRKVLGSAGIGALLLAVVMQALLFGLFHVHQGLGGVLLTGTIGIVLGLVWLVGGRNLWACILLHGLVNTISDVDKYVAPSVSSQAVQQRGAS